MKSSGLLFFVLLVTIHLPVSGSLVAQKVNCQETYFKAGGRSSQVCRTPETHSGIARVYDLSGAVTREWTLSTMHVISTLQFHFHTNGAVSRAVYHSAPDGGIQSWTTVSHFDTLGQFVSEETEERNTLHPSPRVPSPSRPMVQEIVREAPLHISILRISNQSRRNVRVRAYRPGTAMPDWIMLKPGQEADVYERIMAGIFENPQPFVHVEVTWGSGKKVYNLEPAVVEELKPEGQRKTYRLVYR